MGPDEYLLDTQALRSLSFGTIRKAVARGLRLAVSPISLWELLTHLDESTDAAGFERRKGWLVKARGLRVLDDPFAAHAHRVEAPGVADESRFDDAPILLDVLDALHTSTTLAAFYDVRITYRGDRRTVKDSAARARDVLADAESDYVRHVHRMIALIDEQIGRAALRTVSDERYVQVASAGTFALADFYGSFGYDAPDLFERVFESIYPHLGYVFERARLYAMSNPLGAPIAVDPNDAEDGMLCLHLGLAADRMLVTNDKGTRRALGEAGARLQRQLAETGTSYSPRLVMTCDEFKAIVDAEPAGTE